MHRTVTFKQQKANRFRGQTLQDAHKSDGYRHLSLHGLDTLKERCLPVAIVCTSRKPLTQPLTQLQRKVINREMHCNWQT